MKYIKSIDVISLIIFAVVLATVYMADGGIGEYVGVIVVGVSLIVYYSFFYKNDRSPRY